MAKLKKTHQAEAPDSLDRSTWQFTTDPETSITYVVLRAPIDPHGMLTNMDDGGTPMDAIGTPAERKVVLSWLTKAQAKIAKAKGFQ